MERESYPGKAVCAGQTLAARPGDNRGSALTGYFLALVLPMSVSFSLLRTFFFP